MLIDILIKYIHLNPIRVKVVRTDEEYPWSSHRFYSGGLVMEDAIIDIGAVLSMFSEDGRKARRLYRAYIGEGEGVKREDIYSTLDQRILGDERFVQKVSKKARKTEIRGRKRHQYTLPEIGEAVQQAYGVSLNQLREKGKNEVIQCGRKVMSLVAKDYGYTKESIID